MRYLAAILLCLVAPAIYAQSPGPAGTLRNPVELTSDSSATVYTRMGMLTSITLLTDRAVESVMKGGPEINHLVEGNVIHVQPLVPEGLSSLTFRVDGVTYTVRIVISSEPPAILNPVFSFPRTGRFEELDRALASAPAMKPGSIDLTGAIRTIERAGYDRAFRETLKNYASLQIHKVYAWNDNEIHLLEAHQFAEQDLILVKIGWVNRTGFAYYLNQNQYRLYIGDRPVAAQARRQAAPRGIVFPGQQETVWLAIQGYKLRLDNDWDLRLPPDAKELRAYVRTSAAQ